MVIWALLNLLSSGVFSRQWCFRASHFQNLIFLVILSNCEQNIDTREMSYILTHYFKFDTATYSFFKVTPVMVSWFVYLFGVLHCLQHCKVISQQVVGGAEETSTYSWSRFCTVNC